MQTALKITAILIALSSASVSSVTYAKNSSGQISSHSLQNSNGKNSLDRDKGLARAADRRSDRSVKNKSGKSKSPAPKPFLK